MRAVDRGPPGRGPRAAGPSRAVGRGPAFSKTRTAVFAKRHQLQEIKIDLSRGNEKTIDVFVFGSETKQLGWIPKKPIGEVERMGQMELKISRITFILVKLTTCHKNFPF